MRNPRLLFWAIPILVLLAVTVYLRQPADPDALRQAVVAALERGDGAAADRWIKSLETRNELDSVHYLRGLAAVRAGRADLEFAAAQPHSAESAGRGREARDHFLAARREFEQVSKESKVHLDAGVLAGECFARLGETKRAIDAFYYVLKRDPDQLAAHRWLADIFHERAAMTPALVHLQAWERLEPDNGFPSWRIAGIYDATGRKGEAMESYRQTLRRKLPPEVLPNAVRRLGVLYVTNGLYQETLELLERYAEVTAGQAPFLALRAESQFGLGEMEKAVMAVDMALKENPDLPESLWLRARIHVQQDQPRAAIPFLEKILRLDKHNVESREMLAQVHNRLGAPEAAKEQRRLLEISKGYDKQITEMTDDARHKPWDADLRFRIAEILMKMDRPEQARGWLKAALACNPAHAEAARLLKQIGR